MNCFSEIININSPDLSPSLSLSAASHTHPTHAYTFMDDWHTWLPNIKPWSRNPILIIDAKWEHESSHLDSKRSEEKEREHERPWEKLCLRSSSPSQGVWLLPKCAFECNAMSSPSDRCSVFIQLLQVCFCHFQTKEICVYIHHYSYHLVLN